MALANVLALSQIAGHVILFILSTCVIIPLGMNHYEFNGHCLLFASGEWREEDGLFNVDWASPGFCRYPLITSVILFVISAIQIYRFTFIREESSFLALFIDVVVGIQMLAMSILAAIMITFGFIVWCSEMTDRFPSCETAAGQNITPGPEKIDTSRFYIEMGTAQFGAWGSFATSVGIAVIALLKLINNHQIRNIKVSMYLERQRLVNEDALNMNEDGKSTPPVAQD